MMQPGDVLKNRYFIDRELGRGGFGIVYLAFDELLLGKRVVIKELNESGLKEAWIRRRFHQEIEALARIDHPGIVTVLDSGTTGEGTPFVVMQFIEGQTLRAVMTGSPLPFDFVATVIRQSGNALAAAHARGVFHRDLKPENIMVQSFEGGGDHVKIIDFGVAKVQESQLSVDATAVGLVTGTLVYMAPEQLCAEAPTAATDVFALAIIAYEMLTASLPFKPAPIISFFESQREGAFPSPRERRPDLPVVAEKVLSRGLAFDQESRFQRIEEFGEELARALTGPSESYLAPQMVSLLTMSSTMNLMNRPRSLREDGPGPIPAPESGSSLSTVENLGGAVPIDSRFYVLRSADDIFRVALSRQDSIVLVKGARQMGKTSLLARGVQKARADGKRVVLTDFQKLNAPALQSAEKFYLALGDLLSDQLDLEVTPDQVWNPRRAPNVNFERYLRREVLGKLEGPLVWAMDEVDRLFSCDFSSEVFGLFRSWHNERALDPSSSWSRLTMAIAYATEVHLFITDMNQSPFNVGTRITLDDFTLREVTDLNGRYGSPLRSQDDIRRFFELLGGHPYLVRRGFHALVAEGVSLSGLEETGERERSPFSDHLERLLLLVNRDAELASGVRNLLAQNRGLPSAVFYRLRSAGVIRGLSAAEAQLRCRLYRSFLESHFV